MKTTLRALTVLLLAALLLSVISPVLAQETEERQGLRMDAPEYALRGPHWVGYRQVVIGEGAENPLDASLWYPALNPEGVEEEITYSFTLQNPGFGADKPPEVLGRGLIPCLD